MDVQKTFETFVKDIIGMEVSHIWRGYGSALFLELGKLTPRTRRDGSSGNPEGEVSISIEWSWRVEDDTAIICGSWSEEELWEASFDKLRRATLGELKLFGRLPEIQVTFSGGIRLISFSTTDGQPQWDLIDHRSEIDRWFFVREGLLYQGDGSELAD